VINVKAFARLHCRVLLFGRELDFVISHGSVGFVGSVAQGILIA
jgi:hypothetical protein